MQPPELPDNVATAEPRRPKTLEPLPKDNRKVMLWVIIGLVVLLLGSIVVIVLLMIRNGSEDGQGQVTPTPTVSGTPSVTEIPSITEEPSNTPSVTATPTTTTTPTPVPQSNIQGKIGYPSEFYPAMKICAVNISSSKETCINKAEGKNTFKVVVDPGQYRVYAQLVGQPDQIAYSTQEDAKGHPLTGGKPEWSNAGFVCHTDAACTAWFKPAVVKVLLGAEGTANIGEGWYLPSDEKWSDFM